MATTIKTFFEFLGVFAITFIVYSAFFLIPAEITGMSIAGDMTTGTELVYENGSVAELGYDNLSKAYHDLSFANPNVKLKVCSNVTGASDFNDKYFALYYIKDSTNKIKVSIQPTLVTSNTVRDGDCVYQDLDISPMTSFYPGIPQVLMSTDSEFSFYDEFNLSNTTGYLKGSFNLSYQKTGGYTYVTVENIYDEDGNEITESWPYLLVSVKNETDDVYFSQLTQPGVQVVAPNTTENFSIFVNNYEYIINTQVEICDNGLDDDIDGDIDCDDTDCASYAGCAASSGSSGSTYYGGGSHTYCQFKWQCTDWSRCQIDGFQYRDCVDLNKCYEKINIRKTYFATERGEDGATIQPCEYFPECDDGIRNGIESDTDCGGSECEKCEEGKFCNGNEDCMSENCKENICYAPDIYCLTDRECPRGYSCMDHKCERTPFIAELDYVPLPDDEKIRLFGIGIIVSLSSSMLILIGKKKIPLAMAAFVKYIGEKTNLFGKFMNKEYEHVKDFLGTEKVPDQPLKERTIEDVHKEVISKHLKGLRRNYEMNEIKEKPKVDEKPSQKPIEKVEKTSKERPEDTSTGLSEKTIYDKEMEMLKEELSKVKKKRK